MDSPQSQVTATLALGTAQLGFPYGFNNRTGQPAEAECRALVARALAGDVRWFDCARDYGQAEERLGEALRHISPTGVKVVTKLDKLIQFNPAASAQEVADATWASLEHSRQALQKDCLDAVLVHFWSHRRAWQESVWNTLLQAQRQGWVRRLGASLQTPTEALEALQEPAVEILQIPFNLLDWRWKAAGIPERIGQRPNLVVHVRSVLLQGVLSGRLEAWPRLAIPENCYPENCYPELWRERLLSLVVELQRTNMVDLCLAYVRAQPWIGSVVVGMESLAQMEENLHNFTLPALTPEQVAHVEQALPPAPEGLLNPALWAPR